MKMKHVTQEEVCSWFNTKYKKSGFSYLRPREAYHIFLELLGVQPEKKILDVACGPGLLLSAAHDKGLKMYGVDISAEAIKMCNDLIPQANVTVANAESLPYPDNHFDYVTCLGSLERFIHPVNALSEQIRVAREGARFCYMVRNANTFVWRCFMQLLHMQNFQGHQGAKSLQEWTSLFCQSGMEVLSVYHDHWPYLRFLRWVTFGGKGIDYRKVRRSLLPIKYVNEFIFILKKRSG